MNQMIIDHEKAEQKNELDQRKCDAYEKVFREELEQKFITLGQADMHEILSEHTLGLDICNLRDAMVAKDASAVLEFMNSAKAAWIDYEVEQTDWAKVLA